MYLLELRDVGVVKGGVVLFKGLDLVINSGSIICIRGRNGVGKTTLARLVALVEKPTWGTVRILGVDAWGSRESIRSRVKLESIGYVPQFAGLIEELTGWENVELPLRLLGYPSDVRRRLILETSRILGVEGLLDKKPSEMSGGERMKIAIVRAIAKRPKILVLDEPTASLDPQSSENLYRLMEKLGMEGVGLMVTTTDPREPLPCTEDYMLQGKLTPMR